MTKRITILFLALSLIFVGCKKDEEQPTPNLSGNYTFKSATLIDGNILNPATTDLVILNAVTDPDADPVNSLTLEAGESANTSELVDIMLSLSAPCTDQNLSNWAYAINFNTDNSLTFICSSEQNKSEVVGTWALEDSNNTLKLEFSSGLFEGLSSVPVKLKNATFSDGTIKGTIENFPLMKDLDKNINELSNIQLVSFDIVLNK